MLARTVLFFVLIGSAMGVWAGVSPETSIDELRHDFYQNFLDSHQDKRQQMVELFNDRPDVIFSDLGIDCHRTNPIQLSLYSSREQVDQEHDLADIAFQLQRDLLQQTGNQVSELETLSLRALVNFTDRVISHNRCAIAQDSSLGAMCSTEFSGHDRRPHDFGERTRISRRLRVIEETRLSKERALRIIDDFFYWQSFTLCMYMPQIEEAYEMMLNNTLPEGSSVKREATIKPVRSNPFFTN